MENRREDQQVSAMRRSGSRPSDYSGESEQIERAFAALSERERLIGTLLNRVQSLRGLPSFDSTDLLIKISDFAPMLDEIPDWALAESFKLALKVHDYRQPFQVSEVILNWRGMSEATRERLYREQATMDSLPAGPPCRWCNGRGQVRVQWIGCYLPRTEPIKRMLARVFWDSAEHSDGLIPCTHEDAPAAEELPEENRPFNFRQAIKKLKAGFDPVGVSDSKRSARLAELRKQVAQLSESE